MASTIRLTGPVTLDFGKGLRITLAPAGASATTDASAGGARRGRPLSPATQALVDVLRRDAAAGKTRPRADYLAVLRRNGHKGGATSAYIILNREAKRAFGKPLPRGGARATTGRAGGRAGKPAGRGRKGKRGAKRAGKASSPGRKPSPATAAIREKLHQDKAAGTLHDAPHYVRWLVDKANMGLKRARPIVYRELRAVR